MAGVTDPARELADICQKIMGPADKDIKGDDYLASAFQMEAWSTDFYRIIFLIHERADFVAKIVSDLRDIDDDHRSDKLAQIKELKCAFAKQAMQLPWTGQSVGSGPYHLRAQHIEMLKGISPLIRKHYTYPKLNDEEIQETLSEIAQLVTWLEKVQLEDLDSIRQSIIDGLLQFSFCLERIGWFGWGYTHASLKDVIGAYFALERENIDVNTAPVAAALLVKTGILIKDVYEKAYGTKKAWDTARFMTEMYVLASIAYHGGVAGWLEHFKQ